MFRKSRGRPSILVSGLVLSVLILCFSGSGNAGNPLGAYYGTEDTNLFWFIQTSDTHIGARGSADGDHLSWLVNQAHHIIEPSFIIVSGDLTDSTNGNWLGYPIGPYQAEWDEYKSIVDNSEVSPNDYYDIPGNHDAYNDRLFAYYRANSVQGRVTNNTQISFVKSFPFGTYHFLGINTADNSGDGFSLSWPYGDYAGLDSSELSFISQQMNDPINSKSNLTLVFGHHPLFDTGDAQDTYVYYGLPEFLSLMDQHSASLYGYGHTHNSSEAFFVPDRAVSRGFYYFNVASLGKSNENQYTIMAIDCNGLSSKIRTIGTWPAVLITAPVDVNLGGNNPYAYSVPAAASNPIRALVFDPGIVSSVQYRIDGGTQWVNMNRVQENLHLWKALWDTSSLNQGKHTIEVKASSTSGISNDIITVNVEGSAQTPQAGAAILQMGKYVTTGSKKNKVTTLVEDTSFIQGDAIVFQLAITDTNGSAIAGATVQLDIAGPASVTLTSTSDSAGIAEAVWNTSAPNRRGNGGTPTGGYTATIGGVSASGYAWDGVANSKTFTINPKP
jgi:hypothetical protein